MSAVGLIHFLVHCITNPILPLHGDDEFRISCLLKIFLNMQYMVFGSVQSWISVTGGSGPSEKAL